MHKRSYISGSPCGDPIAAARASRGRWSANLEGASRSSCVRRSGDREIGHLVPWMGPRCERGRSQRRARGIRAARSKGSDRGRIGELGGGRGRRRQRGSYRVAALVSGPRARLGDSASDRSRGPWCRSSCQISYLVLTYLRLRGGRAGASAEGELPGRPRRAPRHISRSHLHRLFVVHSYSPIIVLFLDAASSFVSVLFVSFSGRLPVVFLFCLCFFKICSTARPCRGRARRGRPVRR